MPRSYRNLGFYGKMGFVPERLTVCLTEEVFSHPASPEYEPRASGRYFGQLSEPERETFLERARHVAAQVCEGLDYTSLIIGTWEHHYGDSAIFTSECGEALAIGHTEPYAADEERHVLRVVACVVRPPASPEFIDSLLASLRDWARREFLGHLNFWVPTAQLGAFRYLLARNFRVVHSDLRMTLDGYPLVTQPGGWLLDKWE